MNLQENISRIKEVMGINEEKDPTAKFIKCKNCKKKFTQTLHKGKKSLAVCPYCGTHNTGTKKEVEEGFTDFILKKFNKYPFHEYQKAVNKFMNLLNLIQINDDEDFLKITHLVKPSGEVVVRVRNSSEKKGKVIYVSWKLMNELESYIPSRGLVICVAKWVEKKLNLDNVKGWEIFLD